MDGESISWEGGKIRKQLLEVEISRTCHLSCVLGIGTLLLLSYPAVPTRSAQEKEGGDALPHVPTRLVPSGH